MIPDKEIIALHRQLYLPSCTAMAVELVLKLLKRVAPNWFILQYQTQMTAVSFAEYDNLEICGVRFHRRFSVDAGRNFSPEKLGQLFEAIDGELGAGRYVIVSIANDPKDGAKGWHDFVIYDHAENGEYRAVSKVYRPNGDFDHPEAT
jgi:hypothetical protein